MSDEIKVKLILEAQKALQDAKALADSFGKLTTDADAAATAAQKYTEYLKKQAAEQEHAKRAAEETAAAMQRQTEKVGELFLKGFGGGEVAEKMRDVSRALDAAGDSSLRSSTRFTAAASSLALAGRSALAMGRMVHDAAEQFSALSRRANDAEATRFSLWWDQTKVKADRFVDALVRVGESQASLNPVHRATAAAVEGVVGAIERATTVANDAAATLRRWSNTLHETAPGLQRFLGIELGTAETTERLKDAQHGAGDASAQLHAKVTTLATALLATGDAMRTLKNETAAFSATAREGETRAAFIARVIATGAEAIRANRQRQADLREARRTLVGTGAATEAEANAQLGLSSPSAARRPGETYEQAVARMRVDDERNATNQTFTEGFNANVRAGQYAASQGAAFYSAGASRARGRRDANELAAGAQAGDALARRVRGQLDDNSLGGQVRSQFGIVRDEQTHLLRSSQTFAQQFSATVGGAFNSVTAAASNHFAALIEGRETAGEALRGFVHDSLMALAQDAFVKALYNTGQGFAFLASYQYPQAASAFTAAGIFAGIAALAGLGGALTNAPAQSALPAQASGGGAGRSARLGSGDTGGASGGGQTIINVTYGGPVYSREHAAREVMAMVKDAVAQGVPLPR